MNQRRLPWLIALLVGAFVTWWILAPPRGKKEDSRVSSAEKKPAKVTTTQQGPQALPTATGPEPVAPPDMLPNAPAPQSKQANAFTPEQRGETVHAEAKQDIERVQGMLRDFRTVFGENPVGTNAEIMAALNGGNPKQARLGPAEGQGLNEKGELVDQWGTPYFFHQMDGHHMEIHSAGADRKLGTSDDVVSR